MKNHRIKINSIVVGMLSAASLLLSWKNGRPTVLPSFRDSIPYKISVDWKSVEAVSKTSLTIQVCPEPPMRRGHPAGKNIYKSLRDMKVNYARLQPWYPYPKLGVAELEPPKDGKTSWDFSVIDPIVIDFIKAAEGRPVMLNFSTIPQWMIKTDTAVAYPKDPNAIAWNYSPGNQFRDTTLKELVDYYHRLISWYTKGGFTDEYGKFHKSGYFFKIDWWEVLNENDQDTQHLFSPEMLTKIYDAVVGDLMKLNPGMKFSALALAFPHTGGPYAEHFLNPKNHQPGIPLDMFSYHNYIMAGGEKWLEGEALNKQYYSYFERMDDFFKVADQLEAIKKRLSPNTKTFISELGTLPIGNPSDAELVIPRIYWHVSSAMFAYAYAGMAKKGIDILAIAELIDYPGQFAGTSILHWNTGLPNPRYQGMKLLQQNFSPGDKLVKTVQTDSVLFSQGFITVKGKRKILLINKSNKIVNALVPAGKGAAMQFVDVNSGSRPASSKILTSATVALQPYTVAVIIFNK